MSEKPVKYEANKAVVNYKVTEKDIDDYLFGTNTKLTEQQRSLFKNIALMCNLNPFKREIYAIPYEKKVKVDNKWVSETIMTVVTGYQVYLKRAEATGLLNGYNVSVTKKDNKIVSAKIVIARKDWAIPFEFEISFDEFVKKNSNGEPMGAYATMPEFMIKKCIIGIGFRLCFPNELGGLPYLAEELSSMTYEEVQNAEKELLEKIKNNSSDRVLMSKSTKLEILGIADNNTEVINEALKRLNINKEDLLESDKEILINKIKEILNENTTSKKQ